MIELTTALLISLLSQHMQTINTALPDERAHEYAETMVVYSHSESVHWSEVYAVAWTESHFHNTVGDHHMPNPAYGLMQVREPAWKQVDMTFTGDPTYQYRRTIIAGIEYLEYCHDRFGGKLYQCYNAGATSVSNGSIPEHTKDYERMVTKKQRTIMRYVFNETNPNLCR